DGEMHTRRRVRERAAQHDRADADVARRDAVRQVDDTRLRTAPGDDRVADAGVLVVQAVVRQERDRRGARAQAGPPPAGAACPLTAASAQTASSRPSMSWRTA